MAKLNHAKARRYEKVRHQGYEFVYSMDTCPYGFQAIEAEQKEARARTRRMRRRARLSEMTVKLGLG